MTETPSTPAKSTPPAKPGRRKSDRRVKLVFLAAALAIVAWLLVKQYYGPPPPFPWTSDFAAALNKAKAENRRIVLIVYTRLPGEDYKRSVEGTISRSENREAFKESGALCVRVTPSDPAFQKWLASQGMQEPELPAFYLLRPDGLPAWVEVSGPMRQVHTGMMPEVPFRHGFLDGAPVRFGTKLDEALAQAQAEDGRVLALIDTDPPSKAGEAFWEQVLWTPAVIEALDRAKPLCVRITVDEARKAGLPSATSPTILLLAPNRQFLARHEGPIDAATFVEKFFSQ